MADDDDETDVFSAHSPDDLPPRPRSVLHTAILLSDEEEGEDDDINVMLNRRQKRRRVAIESQDEDEVCINMGDDKEPTPSTSHEPEDGADDACNICYEEYSCTGNHRLASLKCGHFFGDSCIRTWIEGSNTRTGTCPTCKAKATKRDVRLHFAKTVKMVDNTELEGLKVLNKELQNQIITLQRGTAQLEQKILILEQSGASLKRPVEVNITSRHTGKMLMIPRNKLELQVSETRLCSRSFDWNGQWLAVGMASSTGNIFFPYSICCVDFGQDSRFRFVTNSTYPIHNQRVRVIVFSPFEATKVLSGGEDSRVVVHLIDTGEKVREWKLPEGKHVWSACWTGPSMVLIGSASGRIWEWDLDSDSERPLRDLSNGNGRLPLIFLAVDRESGTVLASSFLKLTAYRNGQEFLLLSSTEDNFVRIRGVTYDYASMSFVVTLAPGGRAGSRISHRLYRLEVDQENNSVSCVEVYDVLTSSVLSTTMWNNCLFSINDNLILLYFDESRKAIVAHDFQERMPDVLASMKSSANVSHIMTLPSTQPNHRRIVAITDRSLYSIDFQIVPQ